MQLKITTWNINSVRLRIDLVAKFVKAARPDVICLQETKCPDDRFPLKRFRRLGYPHAALNGQKGYHGVAVLSRLPLDSIDVRNYCGKSDSRHLAVRIGERAGLADPVTVHNFYVPAGGDEPDPAVNEKFAHKLAFLDEMQVAPDLRPARADRAVVVGDLNVAPLEHDVWSHRQLLNVVSHTPVETNLLGAAKAAFDWTDVTREFVPHDQKSYSWWSYRAADWEASNRGRRLDHVWVSPALKGGLRSQSIVTKMRGWQRASDHVPVVAEIDV